MEGEQNSEPITISDSGELVSGSPSPVWSGPERTNRRNVKRVNYSVPQAFQLQLKPPAIEKQETPVLQLGQDEKRSPTHLQQHSEIVPIPGNDEEALQELGGWKEPPLAEPTPIVTGQPLGALPSKKIQKEAFGSRKRSPANRSTKKQPTTTTTTTTTNNITPNTPQSVALENIKPKSSENINKKFDVSDLIMDPKSIKYEYSEAPSTIKTHEEYQDALETSRSERLTKFSSERSYASGTIKAKPKKEQVEETEDLSRQGAPPPQSNGSTGTGTGTGETGSGPTRLKVILKVPSTPTKPKQENNNNNHMKKIKKSPKKIRNNAFGYGLTDLSGQKRSGAFDFEDSTKDNEDFCSACGGAGVFLCCEACPKSFHFLCCDPPFEEDNLPEGNWFCNECSAKRKKLIKYDVGIFSKLLNQAERRNPRKFQLPRKLRESTFENVSTGPFGEYQDASVIKNTRPVKLGKLEESEVANVFDSNGKPYICYKCGISGMEKPIAKCGYCDLSWHLDCVNPPLSSAKTLGTKWRCPNHVSDLIPNKRRRFKKQNYVDVAISRGFDNNGDIEIVPEDNDNEYEDIVQLPIPEYFDSYYQNGAVHATVSEEMDRIITMNNVTYRIPEKGIILDFIDNAKVKKLEELVTLEKDNAAMISDIHGKGLKETEEFLESASQFHDQKQLQIQPSSLMPAPAPLPLPSFEQLLSVVNEELIPTKIADKLSTEEIEELKYLKALIDMKGRDKLLSFLQDSS